MNIIDFLKSLYLGDRGCKSIFIDGWNSEVKIQVTCISRVRTASWDFNTEEDLIDGYIVFEGVKGIAFEPAGFVPNDSINEMRAESLFEEDAKYLITISVDSVNKLGSHTEVEIRIRADSMALEKFDMPGHRLV